MKIRKVAQSVGVLGKILNLFSNSNKDTYSCDYLNNNDTYSTNEIKTNKRWINGKPIYRKVITGNMSEGTKAHGITDLDTFTYIGGFFHNPNSGKYFAIPSVRPQYPEYAVGVFADNVNLLLERAGSAQSATHTFAVTLEYTKTTD